MKRFTELPPTPDYCACDHCGRQDWSEIHTTGQLLTMWDDADTGETLCPSCMALEAANVAPS
jgi:hypothetical protein